MFLDVLGIQYGGGGGNRTRVRKSSAIGSTCLVGLVVLTLVVQPTTPLRAILLNFAFTVQTPVNTSLSKMTVDSNPISETWSTGRGFLASHGALEV